MAKRGTPITKITSGDEAASAAAEAAAKLGVEAEEEPTPAPEPVKPIDGITDEQALRIREAVRAHKRRKRAEADGAA